MSNSHGLIDTILEGLAPVHRDGYKFIAIAGALSLLGFMLYAPIGWLFLVVTIYIAYFFRDPARVTPLREGLVIAPADGVVTGVDLVQPPMELGLGDAQRVRISTFLSVLDVHINRAPVAGRVVRSIYVPGAFINAAADKASEENERRSLVIQMTSGDEVAVVQIAGLIARRIVLFAHEGDQLGVGERFGLIRFGSRVDVYLPVGRTAIAAVGQRAVGGETVLADFQSSETERESRRS